MGKTPTGSLTGHKGGGHLEELAHGHTHNKCPCQHLVEQHLSKCTYHHNVEQIAAYLQQNKQLFILLVASSGALLGLLWHRLPSGSLTCL